MHKLLIAAAAAAFAAPALAQTPEYEDPLADEIVRTIPSGEEIEAMAPALDRSLGVLMDVDVGPLVDALDPLRRSPGYGAPGRTIGEMAGRDDPHFEERLRASLYGATEDMGRMMGAFVAAAPALARSLREMERAMGAVIDDYHRGRGYPREPWQEPEYYPED